MLAFCLSVYVDVYNNTNIKYNSLETRYDFIKKKTLMVAGFLLFLFCVVLFCFVLFLFYCCCFYLC